MTTPTEARIVRRNRILLVGLFAITIVPMFGAFWLYESSRSAAPWATTNRGELLNPIVPVADLRLASADGASSMHNSGQWWLIVVTEDGCTSDCQNAVHQLRQLHILLGRDATRVKRGLVSLGGATVDASLAQYPELVRFTGETAALLPGVYIIDPLGNIVLRYDYHSAGKPVLEDLKQLLKVSHIG
jgi:cytochrome oxidase Cu insertion factor (SCO1/SenC/PrrC family)